MNNLRSQFPILQTQLNGHGLIYLDSAATSQKPQIVIDAMTDFYSNHNASSHSVHSLGGKVTEMVEQTRQQVADFVGSDYEEIVFTSGATDGINFIANGFLEASLKCLGSLGDSKMLPLSVGITPVNFVASPFARGNLGLTQSHSGTGSFACRGKASFGEPESTSHLLKMTDSLVSKFPLDTNSEILICVDQHHSNILPWQRLADIIGCKIVFFGVLSDGRWNVQDFESKLNKHTKLIAISNVSNVLGVMQDVEAMNKILELKFKKNNCHIEQSEISYTSFDKLPRLSHIGSQTHQTGFFATLKMTDSWIKPIVVLDGTQAVSHFDVDVKELDVDFMVFSGHKIYGPTGVGVLYGKKELLEVLPNYRVGGDMVESVSFENNIYKESPFRFEAGTGNFGSIIGLQAALNWFIRSQDEIFKIEKKLLEYLITRLKEVEGLQILGEFKNSECDISLKLLDQFPSGTGSFAPLKMTVKLDSIRKIPLVSFNIEGLNSLDLALLLDQKGICIRSGQHCAGILHEYLGVESSCRISLACFNTFAEIDLVVNCIKDAFKILK